MFARWRDCRLVVSLFGWLPVAIHMHDEHWPERPQIHVASDKRCSTFWEYRGGLIDQYYAQELGGGYDCRKTDFTLKNNIQSPRPRKRLVRGCETFLPGPAWLLLRKTCISFPGPLYCIGEILETPSTSFQPSASWLNYVLTKAQPSNGFVQSWNNPISHSMYKARQLCFVKRWLTNFSMKAWISSIHTSFLAI